MNINIINIINCFRYDGAEAMLCNLLSRADRGRFKPVVVALNRVRYVAPVGPEPRRPRPPRRSQWYAPFRRPLR
jgi:hypothetical protein